MDDFPVRVEASISPFVSEKETGELPDEDSRDDESNEDDGNDFKHFFSPSILTPNLLRKTSWQNGSISQKAMVRNPAHPAARLNPPTPLKRSMCVRSFMES
jgi:hypothetical protein